MACTRDLLGHYTLNSATEDEILRAAEDILTRRFSRGELLSDPSAAGRILQARLAHIEREVFTVLFLDTRHRLLAVEDLFQGTIDGCEVHVREIAKRALQLNASAVILGHQHPSGNPEPSAADRAVNARV